MQIPYSPNKASRRLIICDPVCVLPYGHNATAMEYFRHHFLGKFSEVECLGAKYLPERIAINAEITPFFEFLYGRFINVESDEIDLWTDDIVRKNIRNRRDVFLEVAVQDFRRVMSQFSLGCNDAILLPSADFYAVLGLLKAVQGISRDRCPQIYLRFIGVMENASYSSTAPLEMLVAEIRRCVLAGFPLSISAETPPYADLLASHLDMNVLVTPYPMAKLQLQMPPSGPFTVFYAGSARHDKGWGRILDITTQVRRSAQGRGVQFLLQLLPDRDLIYWQTYASQLYATPGVELIPASISSEEMHQLYSRSHAVLLPYDEEIYRLRGSAILMESLAYGRYVMASRRVGFAGQIEYYNAGVLCESNVDFAEAVIGASLRDRDQLQRQMRQARSRFLVDTETSYQTWVR